MFRSLRVLPACSVVALAALGACAVDDPAAGTQIGVEEDGPHCVEVSSEVLTDLDAVPEGFAHSPQEVVDGMVGAFSGAQLDAYEEPTAAQVLLQVDAGGGDVVLVRYEVEEGDGPGNEVAVFCPDVYVLDLEVRLEADGLPTFEGPMTVRVDDQAEAWAEHEGADAFDGALPPPTTFDPDAVDMVAPHLLLSGAAGSWWATVSWRAEQHDGQGEDGGHSLLNELLMMARLEGQA